MYVHVSNSTGVKCSICFILLLLVTCLCIGGILLWMEYLPISISLFLDSPLIPHRSTKGTPGDTLVAVRNASIDASANLSLPEASGSKHGGEGKGPISQAFSPQQHHFLLNEPDLCERKKPFLVVVVPVHPGNHRARAVIRMTWGSDTLVRGAKMVTTVFLQGVASSERESVQERLVKESASFHDIVQGDFVDSDHNQTLKTVVLMDWLATYCPRASYAMKIDAAMLLNVENLVELLFLHNTPKADYITGLLPLESPDHTYPPYMIGMVYIFSNDLPGRLVQVSKNIVLSDVEHVYVGMCLQHLGITPGLLLRPNQFRPLMSVPFNHCDYVGVVTVLLSNSEQLLECWAVFKAGGSTCGEGGATP